MRGVLVLVFVLFAGCLQSGPALVCPAPCLQVLDAQSGYAWEPNVAVDPTDAAHIVAVWTRYVGTGGYVASDILVVASQDGGTTWTSASVPHGADAAPGSPLSPYLFLGDPSAVFTTDGQLVVTGLAIDAAMSPVGNYGTGFRVFSVRSPDEGATFETPVLLADSASVKTQTALGNRGLVGQAPDFPRVAPTPDGRLVATWRSIDQDTPGGQDHSRPLFSVSDDAGRSWSDPTPIAVPGRDAAAWDILVTPAGTWLVAFERWDESQPDVIATFETVIGRSTDEGAHWSFTPVSSGLTFNGGFAATAQGLGFVSERSDDGDAVLALLTSTDDGRTFGDGAVLARWQDAGGHEVFYPAVVGDGERGVVTYFVAEGATYALRAVALQGERSPVTLRDGLTVDPGATGEYFGLATLPDGAFAVWTTDEGEGRLEGARLQWN